ncbi:MAG: 50S ribosomal protein L16 [Methanothrix sp.]|nr:50S ribosomal protein L16 [Methanothrix sp.]OPX80750.1 MAG: 50S ribosomal protein L10e [Methanosaeta sp. PtaB.Bin087]OPY53270.1 MAG: 50S ribosomal protein L10e [Methanosaeta sp. PtaU1.Bin055]NLX39457.1 50S ribosomal protein L16 [Methanothrix sp.]HNR58464.1 50S ribosomal protein L16 [Methanothrix sp.]
MTRKPASMYRRLERPYTRREYMGGVPGSKVVHFDMGNLNTEFPVTLTLVAKEPCQIRHTALEAARVTANRYLMTYVGRLNFHMKLRVYPHQVIRENKQATGAGADRVSSGMRHAFGKAVGTAARVDAEQKIFSVSTTPQGVPQAKMALRRAGHKLPTPIYIVVEKGAELIK